MTEHDINQWIIKTELESTKFTGSIYQCVYKQGLTSGEWLERCYYNKRGGASIPQKELEQVKTRE